MSLYFVLILAKTSVFGSVENGGCFKRRTGGEVLSDASALVLCFQTTT
jgi:hypothetical protein